jgi:acyl-CoA thioesterase
VIHPLDADTALEPLGDGRWSARIHERWWIVHGPYGGYLSAILMRALLAIAPQRPPRTLAVHFLDAPKVGLVEVAATVERTGGGSTSVSLRMEQAGRPMALALANCGNWREGGLGWNESAMPRVPGPEECVPFPLGGAVPFVDQLEVRVVENGPGPRNAAWVRPRSARPLDAIGLALVADTWMPASFSHFGRILFVPTIDLTIHVRAPLMPYDWVLAAFSSRLASGGQWDEDGELWSPDGRLLAQSRQLALIRDPAL